MRQELETLQPRMEEMQAMLEAQIPGLRDCEWQWEEACQRQKDLVEKVASDVVSTLTS